MKRVMFAAGIMLSALLTVLTVARVASAGQVLNQNITLDTASLTIQRNHPRGRDSQARDRPRSPMKRWIRLAVGALLAPSLLGGLAAAGPARAQAVPQIVPLVA